MKPHWKQWDQSSALKHAILQTSLQIMSHSILTAAASGPQLHMKSFTPHRIRVHQGSYLEPELGPIHHTRRLGQITNWPIPKLLHSCAVPWISELVSKGKPPGPIQMHCICFGSASSNAETSARSNKQSKNPRVRICCRTCKCVFHLRYTTQCLVKMTIVIVLLFFCCFTICNV